MTNERPKLGFTEELENFDPSSWEPASQPRKSVAPGEQATSLAEAAGFRSREPKLAPALPEPRPQRRRRTGRNTQFNIKADPLVIERFVKIADDQGWVFGEALEHAVALLEQRYGRGENVPVLED